MQYRKNISYIFIPFQFRHQADYRRLNQAFSDSGRWQLIHDEILYMFKFVADKLDSRDPDKCQCFHYRLCENTRRAAGMAGEETWFYTPEHAFAGKKEKISFQIPDVQMFCFSTSVCILAFQVHMEKDDPMWISNAQYHLKKVSREPVTGPEGSFTLLDLGKTLMAGLGEFDFFYYANPSTERANFLTYLEVPPQEDYARELYYLRRCYSENFLYTPIPEQEQREIYRSSNDMVWGISPEAAVCLACPPESRRGFVEKTFFRNFNAQYLYMYVLLLHQKYTLYQLLTQLGVGMYNGQERLEEYRHRLYEFETDFVFSCVTEVPQYQMLYERMAEAFSLKQMYEDVHEPLLSLSEMRRAETEKKQKKRDDLLNKALFMISFLTLVSALQDGFGFVEGLSTWLPDPVTAILKWLCAGGIAAVAIYIYKNMKKSREV